MKVSFDFDGTVENENVQQYAKELIKRGVEVWIVTTRYDANHVHKWLDKFPDAEWALIYSQHGGDTLGIPRHHVRFTCMEKKHTYLDGTNFVWHLDDNPEELSYAKANHCNVPMIMVTDPNWKDQCNQIISERLKTYKN